MSETKRKSFWTDVAVTVDIGDLMDNGWHHEDDCPDNRGLAPTPGIVRDALASLHQQAHPAEHPEPFLCREEPCRSLSFEQLMPKASSR
jgi:hypothetical protein